MLEHWCDPAYSGFSWHGKPTTAHTFGRFTFPNLIASKQGNQHNCKINEIWAIRFQDADRGLPRRKECHSIALPSLTVRSIDLRSDTTTQNQTKFHMTHMTQLQLHMTQFQRTFFQSQAKTPRALCVCPTLLNISAARSALPWLTTLARCLSTVLFLFSRTQLSPLDATRVRVACQTRVIR